MGLSKEVFRPTEAGAVFPNANLDSSEIKVSRLPARETRSESRISELLSLIRGEKEKTKHAEKPKLKREDGFEPFVNPEPTDNPLFINGYIGNFAQQMQLNRKGVERVLKIAHLDGQVFLTSLSLNRQRSIEANPDGSVSAKRFLFFGEKIEEQDKDNPLYRVASVPEGWRIEINDARIMEKLQDKNLTGKKLTEQFISSFNQYLRQGLLNCIVREKLTTAKNTHVFIKTIYSLAVVSVNIPFFIVFHAAGITAGITQTFFYFVLSNLMVHMPKIPKHSRFMLRENIDNPMEFLMPPVEIDKVIRSAFFLGIKGRTLVREVKPENK